MSRKADDSENERVAPPDTPVLKRTKYAPAPAVRRPVRRPVRHPENPNSLGLYILFFRILAGLNALCLAIFLLACVSTAGTGGPMHFTMIGLAVQAFVQIVFWMSLAALFTCVNRLVERPIHCMDCGEMVFARISPCPRCASPAV